MSDKKKPMGLVQVQTIVNRHTNEPIGKSVNVTVLRQQARSDDEIRQDYIRCGKGESKYSFVVNEVEKLGGWDHVYIKREWVR